ncbi:MAG TPA: DUF4388 domain-containing protein [Polyangia bacterium]
MTLGAPAYVNDGLLKHLRETVRRVPSDARAWHALGGVALQAGEIGEARFAFTQSVYLAPTAIAEGIVAADLLAKANCPAEAEHLLRRLLERSPNNQDVKLRLVQFLLDTGRESAALTEALEGLQQHPRSIDFHLLAATSLERQDQLIKANEHLASALAIDGNNLEANRRLGTVLTQLGDTAGAVRCWRRIVTRTDGEDIEALTGLGISLSSDGRHAEAVQVLHEVVRRRPGSAEPLCDLGMALNAADQIDEAVGAFNQALAIDPQSPQAYCGLGLAYQKQRRWVEAAQAFRTTEQLAPDNVIGPLNLGLALTEIGDGAGAQRALLRASALAPDDMDVKVALEVAATLETKERTPTPVGVSVRIPTPARTPTPVPGGFGPSITGDLRSFQLFDVLEFLRLQKKTGSLVVSSRQGAGMLRLCNGALTSASAPRVKRLGDVLVDSHVITRAQLESALEHQREDPHENMESLGEVLLREKYIDQARLTVAIRRQVMAALEEMLKWHEGAFSFHPALAGELPPIAMDLQEVMMKLMRMNDERSAGRVPRND